MGRAKNNKTIFIIDHDKVDYIKENREKFIKTTRQSIDWKGLGEIAKSHKDIFELADITAETGVPLSDLCKYGVVKEVTHTPFCYDFTDKQIETITKLFNLYISAMPFQLSAKHIKTILTKHDYIGYVRVINRPLAFLFDELAAKGMACSNWQEIIEKYKLFASRTGKLLKAKDLSAALSRYKDDERQREYTKRPMKETYKTIKEKISTL